MTDTTQPVAEQPQQIITIEPEKYVALVYEPFRAKFDRYKAESEAVTFDITTTAGMKTAVEWRAKFRDEIRIACENARKERKAPILEIGRLLDGKAKEIAEEVAPYESRFDAAIKAEEKRKDNEKIAKAVAESARISAIRKRIAETQAIPSMLVGKSSETIAAAIESLEAVEITLETHQEFTGEGEMAKAATVLKLSAMLEAQKDHEAEQARLAAEREAIERQRAELAEQERLAAAARAEQEAKDRAERERVEAEQRAAQEAAATAMRAEQAAHEARIAAQQAEIDRQQAEIAAERQRQADEAARVEREKQAAITAEAARVAAEEQRKREEAEAAVRAEAERIESARIAAEIEALRRERMEFIKNGPDEVELVLSVAAYWKVLVGDAMSWLKKFDYEAADAKLAEMNAQGGLPHMQEAA
jgi:chemotaxis protein histidine kinase CheA